MSTTPSPEPKFKLGRVVGTPGSAALIENLGLNAADLLRRHVSGDWGDCHPEDAAQNDAALEHGERLMSVYKFNHVAIWIITEYDRSATTLLLPSEY